MTWKEKAVVALKKSIAHWERMAAGIGKDTPTAYECACCVAFDDADCDGCPISERTGEPDCNGTPFYEAQDAFWSRAYNLSYSQADLDAEVEYLKETLRMVEEGIIFPMEEKKIL